ncbi:MAG: DUF4270 family protein [Flavobacteriales bacterium]|nr:DUF4270 family protein [Flavobacteriales bacterium]
MTLTHHHPTARPLRRAVLLFTAITVFASCRKPEEGLGLSILDPAQAVNVVEVDTTTLLAWTVLPEKVRSSGLSRNVLGSYNDRQFGPTKASIVTQVRLGVNNVGSGQDNSGLVADSVVLSMVFDASDPLYGNLDAQRFQVFQLTEDLSLDSTYYTYDQPQADPIDLVEQNSSWIVPRPLTSPVIDGDTLAPQIRLRLEQAFGQHILDAFGTPDLADNTAFVAFLKGLWVVPDNGEQGPFQGGMFILDLLNSASKVTIFYRNTLPGEEDTLSLDLLINENCARYTRCEHDFDAAIDPALPNGLLDSTLGQQIDHLQTLGGPRIRISTPYLERYEDLGGLVVAKAELVVPLTDSQYDAYPPPGSLLMFRVGEDGEDLLLPDQVTSSLDIGGTFDADAREYRFNITRYVQGVLNGTYANGGSSVLPSSGGVTANRAVVRGPADPERPMRLLLTFTKF